MPTARIRCGHAPAAAKLLLWVWAPAMIAGVMTAFTSALGVQNSKAATADELKPELDEICQIIGQTRPTAVNLFWAIRRMQRCFEQLVGNPIPEIKLGLIAEAQRMHDEDVVANQAMGRFGASLIPDAGGVLTHCNAGALATAGYGTALGVIRAAVEAGEALGFLPGDLLEKITPYLRPLHDALLEDALDLARVGYADPLKGEFSDHAVVAQRAQGLSCGLGIRDDHPAFDRGHDMRGIQAETGHVAH